jgi:hypothetical protein
VVTFGSQVRAGLCVDQLRRDLDAVAALANVAFQNVSHAKLLALCASLGSGGEFGDQLYKEFGATKLDGVDFQSAPADEAQGDGYGFWRLDAARAAPEQTQAKG